MKFGQFLIIVAPLLLFGLWALIRFIQKKTLSRFETSVGLSLVLLVYFLATTGTGMFWVAVQELPVFDWHYLPGYILFLLGLIHVAFHYRTILAFLSRRKTTPKTATKEYPKGRPSISILKSVVLVLVVGSISFIAGKANSRTQFSFATPGKTEIIESASGSGEEDPIEPRLLREAPVTIPLSRFYHEGCSYPNRFLLPKLSIQAKPPIVKSYEDPASISIPEPSAVNGPSIIQASRFWSEGKGKETKEISRETLALILYMTEGVNKTIQTPRGDFRLRTAPSAGALYPYNVYVVAERVTGVRPGLYYFNPHESMLQMVKEGPVANEIANASGSPGAILSAPAIFIFTATFARTAFKYGDRSYRYVGMDTGHAAFNTALTAAAEELRAPMIVRFDDEKINRLLGLNPSEEAALLIQPIGTIPEPMKAEPGFLLSKLPEEVKEKGSIFDLIHGATSLQVGKTIRDRDRFPGLDEPNLGQIKLPDPTMGRPLYDSIRARRSRRNFSGATMDISELSALCQSADGYGSYGKSSDPLLTGSAPLDLYVLVRDVNKLGKGVYRYHPADHSLELVKAGDFANACMEACLMQNFCATANAVFFKTLKWDYITYPDGDRGYRYALLRAGIMGEGLYLQGTALDIGVCGVGAFYDQKIAELIGIDPETDACLYIVAAGKI